MDSCYELRRYSVFVAKVQEYLAAKQNLTQAIKKGDNFNSKKALVRVERIRAFINMLWDYFTAS